MIFSYLWACEPTPSLERVSLSWVTSIERLFWNPCLTPVFHGSLAKQKHVKTITKCFDFPVDEIEEKSRAIFVITNKLPNYYFVSYIRIQNSNLKTFEFLLRCKITFLCYTILSSFVCWWNYNIVFSIFVQQMLSKYHVILYPWKVTARTQTHKIIVLFQHFRIYKNSLRHWTELLFKV